MPISVVFADDYEVMRRGIRRLLEADPEIEILGEAKDYAETMSLTAARSPQVVVMDLHMPAPEGFKPIHIKDLMLKTSSRLIAISIWDDREANELAADFGARVLLDKPTMALDLIHTIRRVAAAA